MILLTYKEKGRVGVKQIPYIDKWVAIKKADALYKKGYTNIKVCKIKEDIIYIPTGEN